MRSPKSRGENAETNERISPRRVTLVHNTMKRGVKGDKRVIAVKLFLAGEIVLEMKKTVRLRRTREGNRKVLLKKKK